MSATTSYIHTGHIFTRIPLVTICHSQIILLFTTFLHTDYITLYYFTTKGRPPTTKALGLIMAKRRGRKGVLRQHINVTSECVLILLFNKLS